jgi:hypothetical protein
MAPVVTDSFAGADRINVYVVVNGQLESPPKTTRARSIDILSRSVSTNFQHSARASVALAYNVRSLTQYDFQVYRYPWVLPVPRPLEMSKDAMSRLISLRGTLRGQDLLWKSPEDTYKVVTEVATPIKSESACPSAMAGTLRANYPPQ